MPKPISLRTARDEGRISEFVAEHSKDAPGDKRAFDATLSSMAQKSKPAPGTSKRGRSAG